MKIRFKIAFFLINIGIKLLPEDYRDKKTLNNFMATNIIKDEVDSIFPFMFKLLSLCCDMPSLINIFYVFGLLHKYIASKMKITEWKKYPVRT